MTNTLRLVSVGTILGLLAFAASFFVAGTVSAAGANDLIKCPDTSAVYFLAEDGQRYAFPNEKVYKTWYAGFDEVKEVSCDTLAGVKYGGVVEYRAGVRLIKIPSVPKVYAVESNGVLRPIKSEAQAKKLYGDDWAKKVDDLSEASLPRYIMGTEIGEDELPEGMILEDSDGGLVQVDSDGELIDVESVLSEKDKALLRGHAHKKASLEARIGRVLSKIHDLESQIDRLQRHLKRLMAVDVADDEQATEDVDIDETEEHTDDPTHVDDNGGVVDDLPDFVIKEITLSSSGAISATVMNKGGVKSPRDIGVFFYLDGVLEWTYSTATLSDRRMLNAGGYSAISPQVIRGQRSVRVCADALKQVHEINEANNCKTQVLTAEEGDFDLKLGSVDAVNAYGDTDETVRSFGFTTSGPVDHYRVRIWDSSGHIHDEFVQQVIGSTSVTSFYLSPSWLTPLRAGSVYNYEIHAEEYGTGDSDTEKGTFDTAPAPQPPADDPVDDVVTDDTADDTTDDTQDTADDTADDGSDTAVDPVLTASFATAPGSQTFTRGAEDVYLGSFDFENSSSDDIELDDVTLHLFGDDDNDLSNGMNNNFISSIQNHFTACWLIDGNASNTTTMVSSLEAFDSTAQIDFENMNWVIAPGSTARFAMMCDLSSTQVESGDPDAYSVTLIFEQDFEAEFMSTGNSLTTAEKALSPAYSVGGHLNGAVDYRIIVLEEGMLLMESDMALPAGDVIVAGSGTSEIAQYMMASNYEDMTINEISIDLDGDIAGVDYVKISFDAYLGGSTTHVGYINSDGLVTLSGLNWQIVDGQWGSMTVGIGLNTNAQIGDTLVASLNPSGYGPTAIGSNSAAVIGASNIVPSTPLLGPTVYVN
ncbi:MAG TPA: CARDB domain-containing protein [Patescibacteria group bacterium]|nr:CARDB domain-containing protein [Patescibacteria group bacterium]